MLRVQDAIDLFVWRPPQALHEVDDGLLLFHEEPLDSLADVCHMVLHGHVAIMIEKLHNNICPSHRAHGNTKGLQHICTLDLGAHLGKAKIGLHLVHQPLELRPAIDLHVEHGDADIVSEALDVLLYVLKHLVGAWLKHPRSAERLVISVEVPQLNIQGDPVDVRPDDALHDVREAIGEGHAACANRREHPRRLRLLQLVAQLLLAQRHGAL
mmetsp:Transcript_36498/g.103847  ORF Transcript_36498/g.103847 Transcript_36498/m.103847 type:complete len:212 (+) Transcript_36498:768-1403(+)